MCVGNFGLLVVWYHEFFTEVLIGVCVKTGTVETLRENGSIGHHPLGWYTVAYDLMYMHFREIHFN